MDDSSLMILVIIGVLGVIIGGCILYAVTWENKGYRDDIREARREEWAKKQEVQDEDDNQPS